jgi:AraC family transcriptional regulator
MEPIIETVYGKKLVGMRSSMSLLNDKTGELWRRFMPARWEISSSLGSTLYSIAVYSPSYFDYFSPSNNFEKWAALEVTEFDGLPEGMEGFTLQQGLYAHFHYQGLSTDFSIFEYIFTKWLPISNFLLDTRPHFQMLGEKYKNGDPESEEEIYIPVIRKNK